MIVAAEQHSGGHAHVLYLNIDAVPDEVLWPGYIVLIGDQCHQGVPVSWWGVICKGVWMDGLCQQAAGYFNEVKVLISTVGGFKVVADHWKDVLYNKMQLSLNA